ncbi:MAG: heme A synthase, partial [Gaiellaceae bacterium]
VLVAASLVLLGKAQGGDADARVRPRFRWLIGVLAAQAAVGYTQYFTDVPAVLVGVHVFGSAVVWIAVLWLRLGLTEPARGDLGETRARMDPDADRRLTPA